jgi:hypothetical protein
MRTTSHGIKANQVGAGIEPVAAHIRKGRRGQQSPNEHENSVRQKWLLQKWDERIWSTAVKDIVGWVR